MKPGLRLLLLAMLVGLASVVAMASGPIAWERDQIDTLMAVRLPRVLAALTVGAQLAVAGALLQVLLRNPLADAYVLGVAGGASVGALGLSLGIAALWLGLGSGPAGLVGGAGPFLLQVLPAVENPWLMPVGAVLGAAAVLGLLLRATHRLGRMAASDLPARLILVGAMISAVCGAVVSLLMAISPDTRLRGMVFWLMGDLSGAGDVGVPALLTLVWLALCGWLAPRLNLWLLGDDAAHLLGLDTARLRRQVVVLACMLTAMAVAQAGAVGFVGLVVPHLLRLWGGNDQRWLLPACALGGALFLLTADTLARLVAAPLQLPVGAVSALVGAPLFVALLLGARRA